ncbi:MAG: hypothetical protein KatS3mg109_0001 [Pirellulaceae bacterium]|nr:MAG: hypothetical protein KatS3mg109_0001 [Pirellulaceae bacterium]
MVVIDDDFMRHRVLGSHKVLSAFPMFNPYRAQVAKLERECSTCRGGQARKQLAEVLNTLRRLIAHMPDADKKRLREALDIPASNTVLVAYRAPGPDGKPSIKSVTF